LRERANIDAGRAFSAQDKRFGERIATRISDGFGCAGNDRRRACVDVDQIDCDGVDGDLVDTRDIDGHGVFGGDGAQGQQRYARENTQFGRHHNQTFQISPRVMKSALLKKISAPFQRDANADASGISNPQF
jgi:hypothetical protein